MQSNSNGSAQCGTQPSVVFLVLTLLVTITATALLCTAIMSDHWEYITWDRGKIETITRQFRNHSTKPTIEWLLNGQIVRVLIPPIIRKKEKFMDMILIDNLVPPSLFLVPSYSGLWSVCSIISVEDAQTLRYVDFPADPCFNYLTPSDVIRGDGTRTDSQHRMQNLSISCALVCLIILACSALIGAFGVMQHQISAVLITGVMYLLAAIFAMFTLTIIHFKRTQSKPDCIGNLTTIGTRMDGVYPSLLAQTMPFVLGNTTDYLDARKYINGWSLHLGWGGVCTCVGASLLWILLSKIMRYNPLNVLTVL